MMNVRTIMADVRRYVSTPWGRSIVNVRKEVTEYLTILTRVKV
jgi:hypothetical protein